MAIKRMDSVLVVVDDLETTIEFFLELGMELEGRTSVEGPWVDACIGLDDAQSDIAMMRTPDGHSKLELCRFNRPASINPAPNAPANTHGMGRAMFLVDDLHDTLARLKRFGAEPLGEVAQFENMFLLCYIRGPEGIIVGLSEQLP